MTSNPTAVFDAVPEFEINGHKFKLSKLNAMTQLHVMRKMAPLIEKAIPQLAELSKIKTDIPESEKTEQSMKTLAPILGGLATLSDDDFNYVLYRLLSAVELHQPQFNMWAKVATINGIQMQDFDLATLLQLAGRSLSYNLSGFFSSWGQTRS